MIAAAWLAAMLATVPASAAEDTVECPAGTHHVGTDNPYEPFKCVSTAEENKDVFGPVEGPQGFAFRPKCPRGTRPAEEAGNSLQPYRCVRAATSEPSADIDPDDDAAHSPDAAAKIGIATRARNCPKCPRAYRKFLIPRSISFDYPLDFRVQNEWKEEVPTLYLRLDDDSAGKPVTITITRYAEGQNGYLELGEAIAHDVEWLGAKDGGVAVVCGARARVTVVPGDTRNVYLPVSKNSYYSFVYSAPAESFELYLPSFTRLLKSLKLLGDAQ